MSEHGLGWMDDGLAELSRCGTTRLVTEYVTLDADKREAPTQCPVCGKWLRLVWNVYAEEVAAPASTERAVTEEPTP